MKNIKTLILDNFQQWKKGQINFTNGLNIIIGDTECGKSTLFRAINSILTGKMPENYIRKGTKGCEVKVEFSDGTIFRRLRNKKDNIVDANGIIFERVGKDIPFEYFKQLGPTSIEFGNKELSLCNYSQFEPHFFITLSDYDKSKLIGTICGIDIVDKVMDSINKDIRNNNTNIKFLEQQISQQQAEKDKKIPEFEKLNKKMSQLTEYYNNINQKSELIKKLSELQTQLKIFNKNIQEIKNNKNIIDQKINSFDINKYLLLEKLYIHKNNLTIFKIIKTKIEDQKNNLKIDFFDNKKSQLLENLYYLKEKLVTINKNIIYNKQLKIEVEQNINNFEIKKSELLKDFDKCPLCGGIIHE